MKYITPHLDILKRALVKELKNECRQTTKKLIREGKIKQELRCELCGTIGEDLQVHHNDYNDPYNVSFLCRRCHKFEHTPAMLAFGSPKEPDVDEFLSELKKTLDK